ncbi:MAG: two-component system chemotaxis sensor kinase CheA, partial [Paraglaciecola sp.]
MAFDVDEEILQDFLVEAGEILEQLQEQLVELENNPQDADLLNAIFRGYHTVKGGAGFLSLAELVDICHGAENVFDVMRNGQRSLTPELMDVILQATDEVVGMFARVKDKIPLVAAEQSLLDKLHYLSKPEYQDEKMVTGPEAQNVQSGAVTAKSASDDFDASEFEALLDELHGKGEPVGASQGVISDHTSADSDDISDDDFESLLDQLHGEGQFGSPKAPAANFALQSLSPGADSDDITDDEFEALLDQLHGKGQVPVIKQDTSSQVRDNIKTTEPVAPSPSTPVVSAVKLTEKKAILIAPAATKEEKKSSALQAETTLRVDTKRLDQIMNMVGELVLVRNRLLSLGLTVKNESMSKAITNLDLVTSDLQGAVMKTRMQPIKKVFGRFPRVVRDLAR